MLWYKFNFSIVYVKVESLTLSDGEIPNIAGMTQSFGYI